MTPKRKSRILLIDDDKEFCQKMEKAYENKFDVKFIHEFIHEPKEVYQELKDGDYDLVLLDLFLGKERVTNGFELIGSIRDYSRRLPIVAITIDDRKETTRAALREFDIEDIIWKGKDSFPEWSKVIEKYIKRPSVFISFNHADLSFVELLAQKLKREHIDPLYYIQKTKVGDKIPGVIVEMIHDGDACIVVFSQHSIHSEWVERELGFVIKKKGLKSIIPIKLGAFAMPEDFELQISSLAFLEFEGEDRFVDLRNSLSFQQWLSDFPNSFGELVSSYDRKFQEIVDSVHAKK